MPTVGTRALKMRDQNMMPNDKDKQLQLLPQDNSYQTMAAFAADYNVRRGRSAGLVFRVVHGLVQQEPSRSWFCTCMNMCCGK